ncbi:MAG: HEAT repeat domain-containing protein [Phototrophicaceae bacterium]
MKQIVEYHISRLKDKSATARLKAIQELVLLEDRNSLDALKEVFENDVDEDVRKAAQQAGREIFLKLRAKEDQTSS